MKPHPSIVTADHQLCQWCQPELGIGLEGLGSIHNESGQEQPHILVSTAIIEGLVQGRHPRWHLQWHRRILWKMTNCSKVMKWLIY